jgi:hypothetical protein
MAKRKRDKKKLCRENTAQKSNIEQQNINFQLTEMH